MAKSSVDIFALLQFLDEREMGIYEDFSEDADVLADLQKNIGWLIPQWMSASTNDSDHRKLVSTVNQANLVWNKTYGKHELQTKLMASCGLGRSVRHKFYKASPSMQGLTPMTELLKLHYPDISTEQVILWCNINNENDLQEMAEQCGYQQKEFNTLKEAHRKLLQS